MASLEFKFGRFLAAAAIVGTLLVVGAASAVAVEPGEAADVARSDGYFIDVGYDFASTSFHILTTQGIRGRDKLGQ